MSDISGSGARSAQAFVASSGDGTRRCRAARPDVVRSRRGERRGPASAGRTMLCRYSRSLDGCETHSKTERRPGAFVGTQSHYGLQSTKTRETFMKSNFAPLPVLVTRSAAALALRICNVRGSVTQCACRAASGSRGRAGTPRAIKRYRTIGRIPGYRTFRDVVRCATCRRGHMTCRPEGWVPRRPCGNPEGVGRRRPRSPLRCSSPLRARSELRHITSSTP